LLVGTAIIVVICAIVLPVIGTLRRRATNVVCAARLRELVNACTQYASQHDQSLPAPACDGQPVALPHRLPSRLLNDLRTFVGYPSITAGTSPDMLPPAVQCPDVEAAEGDRGPWQTKDPAVVTYYTGYAYVGGLSTSATPPAFRAPGRVPPRPVWLARLEAAPGPGPKVPAGPKVSTGPKVPAGSKVPGGAAAIAIVLRPHRAARQVGDPAVLWADDVYYSSAADGGYWRFAHARPGSPAATLPLTYADPSACLGQHRAYSDGNVEWVPAERLELRASPGTARIETMTTASPFDAAASYRAGSDYWWF
jgi:hypothetical protein